jgi:hypothetical protein
VRKCGQRRGGRRGYSDEDEEGSDVSDVDQCCCGCGQDALVSGHYCLYSLKRVTTILISTLMKKMVAKNIVHVALAN